MLTGLSKKIELIANVAIIVVACLLVTVLVKNYLLTKPSQGNGTTAKVIQGENPAQNSPTVASLDIDWKQNRQTLILAISSACHFCTESAPFYRRLTEIRGKTRLVAILPQSVQDGKEYLKRLGVAVDQIKQASLDQIGVRGTPTLLLVDSSGVVKRTWVGKLNRDQEQAVLDVL